MAVLKGDFMADVVDVSLEVVGSDTKWPICNVHFIVHKTLNGATWVDTAPNRVKKTWFLTTKIIDKGKFAGKTSIDVMRETLEQAFGYKGRLNEAEMKEFLVNKTARIVCDVKAGKRGDETEVKWVNNPSGEGAYKREAISADTLKMLDKMFSGSDAKPVDPAGAWGEVPA